VVLVDAAVRVDLERVARLLGLREEGEEESAARTDRLASVRSTYRLEQAVARVEDLVRQHEEELPASEKAHSSVPRPSSRSRRGRKLRRTSTPSSPWNDTMSLLRRSSPEYFIISAKASSNRCSRRTMMRQPPPRGRKAGCERK